MHVAGPDTVMDQHGVLAPPRRSVLYIPADKPRALKKAASLTCDAIIFDLEDSVAPDNKAAAREALRAHFRADQVASGERIIRINGLDTPWGTEDLLAARACLPDAILVPKVSSMDDLRAVADALDETDAPDDLDLWAMIETPRGVVQLDRIAGASMRLSALVVGINDLLKATGLSGPDALDHAHPWLMQIVLAARAHGLAALDGVFADLRDSDGFAAACCRSAAMGFDGKTLIHPNQIAAANTVFCPSTEALDRARRIVDAFAQPENKGRGVIALDGQMVERLHLDQAIELLAKAEHIGLNEEQGD